ncbi:Alpha/beta hydrolase fold-1 [Lasallia pustulata]|uniref:Alpha/beta hydrolase fold-1 n=1 Tax=Lasallia pustulata TaxID=136370 RepID=A0A1W5CXV6_9LECA|nr:Alpha/beta hydrolase fold-1 [Lasallia pustulata]
MAILDLDSLSQTLRQHQSQLPLLAAGLAYVGLTLALRARSATLSQDAKITFSPKRTLLPQLSEQEAADLPYPPDVLPGARDVDSPTPCISLGGVAHGLVDKGCRVMLLDLWGRGYSDSPLNVPQDTRLFTTAILLALTTSPLPWTGSSTFALVGYSLGGGITASFTSHFPTLVSSLILLAPAGLLRAHHINRTNKFLFSTGLVPERVLERIIRKRLQGGPSTAMVVKSSEGSAKTAGDAVTEELPKVPNQEGGSLDNTVLSKSRPHITVAAAVAWQAQFHEGFIKSFISSIRYGPVVNQQSDWKRIGARLAAQNASTEERYEREGLQHGKVLIICGETDPVIVKGELMEDATEVLGENCVCFKSCDTGHELPIVRSEMIVGQIWDFWETGS